MENSLSFKLLNSVDISDGRSLRRIALYEGDLTAIPSEHRADILVVSAFPNDYIPTPSSLIGALERCGLSVGRLASAKAYDLRSTCAFWISQPIAGRAAKMNIAQVACFEPGIRGEPPAIVGDLFRGLFPFIDDRKNQTVVMPILAAGDQGWPKEVMLKSILDAAAHWLARGLAIQELKLVERRQDQAIVLSNTFEEFKKGLSIQKLSPQTQTSYEIFLSFSSNDAEAAQRSKTELAKKLDGGKIFDFRLMIDKGKSWQEDIDRAISSSKVIVAISSFILLLIRRNVARS